MGVRVELFDRHAEHVDENIPLCVHDSWDWVEYGDTVKVEADMTMPGWLVTSKLVEAKAEIEIHFISKRLVHVIVNHGDYLAAKREHESNSRTNTVSTI